MIDWGLLVAALLGAAAMTGLIRKIAISKQLLSIPVDRSAHVLPTPQGGGAAIVIAFYLLIGYYHQRGDISSPLLTALLGGVAISALGFIDDLKPLSIRWRIAVQVIAVTWSFFWLDLAITIPLFGWTLQSSMLLTAVSAIALLWLLNLYNFMDGIDGLAATQTITVTLTSSLLVYSSGDYTVLLILTSLGAPTVGFLLWNWPPAKIFMGDVGSNFLGFILGITALVSLQFGSMNLWTWILLLGVFIVDASYTLIARMVKRQPWYLGHNTHAYQRAARQFGSHQIVTLGVMSINLLWLSPLAWLSVQHPQLGVLIATIGITPLLILVRYFRAGNLS